MKYCKKHKQIKSRLHGKKTTTKDEATLNNKNMFTETLKSFSNGKYNCNKTNNESSENILKAIYMKEKKTLKTRISATKEEATRKFKNKQPNYEKKLSK